MTATMTYPQKPDRIIDEPIYSNIHCALNKDVVDILRHDQSLCGIHTAKEYIGYVFCTTDDDGTVRWYEEVWAWYEYQDTFRSTDLQKLIEHVSDVCGHA